MEDVNDAVSLNSHHHLCPNYSRSRVSATAKWNLSLIMITACRDFFYNYNFIFVGGQLQYAPQCTSPKRIISSEGRRGAELMASHQCGNAAMWQSHRGR